MREGELVASILPYLRASVVIGEDFGELAQDILYVDTPDRAGSTDVHVELRDKVAIAMGGLPVARIISVKRPSPGGSRTQKRRLHTVLLSVSPTFDPGLLTLPEGCFIATHAGLKLGPAYICRCSEPAGLHEFLSELPVRQAYLVNSNSAAVIFREEAFATIEALSTHMRTVELHAGSLLEVRAASSGALVFSKTARGVS